jgi:uncharacterized membrane protein YhaH (DUF805 family)
MVSMWEAFVLFWKRYFDFTGNSTRAEYWWMQLWRLIFLAVWVVLIMATASSALLQAAATDTDPIKEVLNGGVALVIVVIIGIFVALAFIIPSIALLIRRYLDAGLAVWVAWVLLALQLMAGAFLTDQNWLNGALAILTLIVTLLPSGTLSQVSGIGNAEQS